MKKCFIIAAKKITLLLNRRDEAKRLNMKMVKYWINKERCANSLEGENDYEDVSTCTHENCQYLLKWYKPVQQDNKAEFHSRYILLKKIDITLPVKLSLIIKEEELNS